MASPQWTVAFFARKHSVVERLLLGLVHTAPFTPHHLRLWAAVLALFTPRGPSGGRVLELLQLRVREPSASRWQVEVVM